MADLSRRDDERGHDPTELRCWATVGTRPSHAWVLARELASRASSSAGGRDRPIRLRLRQFDLGLTDDRPVYLRVKPSSSPSAAELSALDLAVQGGHRSVEEGLKAAGAKEQSKSNDRRRPVSRSDQYARHRFPQRTLEHESLRVNQVS